MTALSKTKAVETAVQSLPKTSMQLEVIVIPVADVDRSKSFYSSLGWRLDADFAVGDAFRVVQFTPPGSRTSVHFGAGLTPAAPGSAKGNYLVVSDIVTARAELAALGADVSEVFHRGGPGQPAVNGRDPQGRSYFSYATLTDPDGNTWLLQEITSRFPGRVEGDTTFSSISDLAATLRRAAAAHGEHEKLTGKHDDNWPNWYAEYIVREQAGQPLPK